MLIPLREELVDNLDVFGPDPSPLAEDSVDFLLHALLTRALGASVEQHVELLPEAVDAAKRHDDNVTVRDLTRLAVCAHVVLETDGADALITDARTRMPSPDEPLGSRYDALALANAGLALSLLAADETSAGRWRAAQLAQPVDTSLDQLVVEMLFLSRKSRPLAAAEAAYVVYQAAVEAGDMMAPLVAGLAHRRVDGSDIWTSVSEGLDATDREFFPAGAREARANAKRVEWSVSDDLVLTLRIDGSGGPLTTPAPLLVPFIGTVPVRLRDLKAGKVRVSQIKGLRKRGQLDAMLEGEMTVEIISELALEPEQPTVYQRRLDAALEWVRSSVDGVSLDGRLSFQHD
jgi:hypothetical protein